MKATKTLPTFFISHGGGPWPWLKKEMPFYGQIEASLIDIPKQLPQKPKLILMVSAHWEENGFYLTGHPTPPMIYDYGGFPEHTYHVKYPAPGAPRIAEEISLLLTRAGFKSLVDPARGFDHGMYSPLVPMYPSADVPVVQLSIHQDYDPITHMNVGRALRPLRDQGVLILGSGLSYHNLRLFGKNEQARKASAEFDGWLHEALLQTPHSDRAAKLASWETAPSARIAHPREDHLVPLWVAFGASEGEEVKTIYHEKDFVGALTVSSFRFGDSA